MNKKNVRELQELLGKTWKFFISLEDLAGRCTCAPGPLPHLSGGPFYLKILKSKNKCPRQYPRLCPQSWLKGQNKDFLQSIFFKCLAPSGACPGRVWPFFKVTTSTGSVFINHWYSTDKWACYLFYFFLFSPTHKSDRLTQLCSCGYCPTSLWFRHPFCCFFIKKSYHFFSPSYNQLSCIFILLAKKF